MLKNNNQAVIRRMASRLLKNNRRRSTVIFLAITLSSFMLFSIFTVGRTYFTMERVQNLRMAGGDYDAILYGITDEQREQCENNPDIKMAGITGVCGYVEETPKDKTPNVGLIWSDSVDWNEICSPARKWMKGTYPQRADELLVTKGALEKCGYGKLGIGDTFTMTYMTANGKNTLTGEFRISGIWDGYGATDDFFVSEEFFEQSGYKLSDVGCGRYHIDFKRNFMTQEEQEDFRQSLALGKQQALIYFNQFTSALQILAGIAGIVLLTCLCAYLLIYNIMHLSVTGNVRYYGLLQTVGMTGRQVSSLILNQVLFLGIGGLASGTLLGAGVSFFIIPSVVKSLGIRQDNIPVAFHPVILLTEVLLVGVTVWLAGRKPAKIAAAVTPVEALSYCPASVGKRRHKTGRIVRRLAVEQLGKNKSRTCLVMVSLAMGLSVFCCVIILLRSQAARTLVSNYMDSDILLINDTVRKEKSEERKQVIDEQLLDALQKEKGVAQAHSLIFGEVMIPWEPDFMESWMEEKYAVWMSVPYQEDKKKYQNHPEQFTSPLLGIDEQEFDFINQMREEPIDREDFLNGRTCLIYREGLDFSEEQVCGKEITCARYDKRGDTRSFKIAGLTDEAYYTAYPGICPTMIVSEKVVREMFENPVIAKISVHYEKEFDEETERQLLALMDESDYAKDFSYESKINEAQYIEKTQGNMMGVGIGIALIFAVIGLSNYASTFVESVRGRMFVFSVMESIGMTEGQIGKMLALEGLLYAAGAWLFTLTAGFGVTYAIFQSMNYRNVPFAVPIIPSLAALIISCIACMAVPILTYRVLGRKNTVAERMRGIE